MQTLILYYKNIVYDGELREYKMKKDDTLQIRKNSIDKAKIKRLAKDRGYKNLAEYIMYLVLKDISASEFINKILL